MRTYFLSLVLLAAGFSQVAPPPTETKVPIAITAKKGDAPNLPPDALVLKQSGDVIPIIELRMPTGRRVAVLLDASGSMRDKMQARADIAAMVLKAAVRPGSDEALLAAFNSEVADSGYVSDIKQLLPLTSRINARGGSGIYDAVCGIAERARAAQQADSNKVNAAVIITDGEDNSSIHNREQAVEAAQRARLVIYVIALEDPPSDQYRKRATAAMERLTFATGGAALFLKSPDDIKGAVVAIARDLENLRWLVYASVPPPKKGANLEVKPAVADKNLVLRMQQSLHPGE